MTIYIVLLGILFVFTMLYDKKFSGKQKKSALRLCGFLMFVLFLIAALRNNVGTDYANYKQAFEYYLAGINPTWFNFEKGFIFLINLFMALKLDLQIWFAAFAGIIMYFTFRSYKKSSLNVMFSIYLYFALYFYFGSLNVVRQFIALSFVLCAIGALIKKQYFKYIVWILLASLFHTTALIMLPFALIAAHKSRIPAYVWAGLSVLFVAFFAKPLMSFLAMLLPKYASYLNYSGGGASVNLIISVAMLLLLDLAGKRIQRMDTLPQIGNELYSDRKNVNRMMAIFENASIFSICFYSLASTNTLFSRIAMYFYIVGTLSIPFAVYFAFGKRKGLTKFTICLICAAVCVYYLMGNNSGVVPYNWIFTQS